MQKQGLLVGILAALVAVGITSSYFVLRIRSVREAEMEALARESSARAAANRERDLILAEAEIPATWKDTSVNVNQAFRLASLAAHHTQGQLIRILELSDDQAERVGVEIQATALQEAQLWVNTPAEKRGKNLVREVAALREVRNQKIRVALTEGQVPQFDEWIKTEPLPPEEE